MADPYITSFTINPLNSDHTVHASNSSSTSATFSFTITRPFSGTSYETEGIYLQLVYLNGSTASTLSPQYIYGNQDFNNGSLLSKSYSFSIPAGDIGGKIFIKWSYYNILGSLTGSVYSSIGYTTSEAIVNNNYAVFVKNSNTGAIFAKMDGVYRHIYTTQALNDCFISSFVMSHLSIQNTDPTPVGLPIGKKPDELGSPYAPIPTVPQYAFSANDSNQNLYFVEYLADRIHGWYFNCRLINSPTSSFYFFIKGSSRIGGQPIDFTGPPPFYVSAFKDYSASEPLLTY